MLHTNNLVLEFPTEKDPKAMKWTKGDPGYTRLVLERAIVDAGFEYSVIDESMFPPTYWIKR